ncbi:T6SS effector BTH_I2691 family protein [Pseudomonas bharatica]|uniref:T6SS effector BTH_I2691 family protein n=1 Tax=Pseudomonas bharatica TaxID=2692112 RepID=UPI003B2841CB
MSKPTRSLSELLAISRRASNETLSDELPSPCVSCKRTFTILPLRYGVVSGLEQVAVEQLAPALPAHLGRRLVTPLSHSRYAVRSIREGYVYVFVKRIGRNYVCEGTYRAHDTGLLQPVLTYEPGTPVGGISALGTWTLTVGDPEDVDEARLLFTPDPLSPDMLERYLKTSRYRDRLQRFDLRILANSCGVFDDVITPSLVDSTVAEFLASNNAASRALLEKQAFPPFRSALAPGELPRDMDSIYRNALEKLMDGRGVAVVLDDPIGIVQELNAWRNDAIEMNLPWLKAVDADGISNERKYMVAEALDDVKTAMQLGYVQNAVEAAERKIRDEKRYEMMNATRFGTRFGGPAERGDHHDPELVTHQAELEKFRVFDKYEAMLDWKAKDDIQVEFARRDLRAQQEMGKREADHLAWLDSEMLEQALDLYDRQQPIWGHAFSSQMTLCLIGMNGCSSGSAKLGSWWRDTNIAKRNLAWRALTRNQVEIEERVKEAFATAKVEASELTVDNLGAELGNASGWFQKVVDLMIKADAVTQLAVDVGSHRWFDPQRLAMSLTPFAFLHQHLLSLLPANALDRRLLGPMLAFVHAGLGEVTTRLRMSELAAAGQVANVNRVAGQVNSQINRVRDSIMREFQNGAGGDFRRLRGGLLLAIIEGVILGVKASNREGGEKEYLEYQAAFLITSAAGIELAALGVQSVADRFGSRGVVARGTAVALGGLRLVGGSLATVGGGMLAYVDFIDGKKSFENDFRVLGGAYFLRSALSLGVSVLGGLVSISYTAPLLRLIFGQKSQLQMISAVEGLAGAGLRGIMLRLIGIGSLVTLGISLAIIYLSPDDMEQWCWHSCLKERTSDGFFKPFQDQETELQKLYEALEAVV